MKLTDIVQTDQLLTLHLKVSKDTDIGLEECTKLKRKTSNSRHKIDVANLKLLNGMELNCR